MAKGGHARTLCCTAIRLRNPGVVVRGGIGRAPVGQVGRIAVSRIKGESTAEKTARYLAENLPVSETGRLLSLEQVPTWGLRGD